MSARSAPSIGAPFSRRSCSVAASMWFLRGSVVSGPSVCAAGARTRKAGRAHLGWGRASRSAFCGCRVAKQARLNTEATETGHAVHGEGPPPCQAEYRRLRLRMRSWCPAAGPRPNSEAPPCSGAPDMRLEWRLQRRVCDVGGVIGDRGGRDHRDHFEQVFLAEAGGKKRLAVLIGDPAALLDQRPRTRRERAEPAVIGRAAGADGVHV